MSGYVDAKPEHITGKTIKSAEIYSSSVDLTFTDGTSLVVELRYFGYNGAELESTFWESGGTGE